MVGTRQRTVRDSSRNKQRKRQATQEPSFSSDEGDKPLHGENNSLEKNEESGGDADMINNSEENKRPASVEPLSDSDRERNPASSAKKREQSDGDTLLIRPLTQKELEALSKKLDPVEMDALVKQFNTDDEIVRLGQRYSNLIKCSVHLATAMSSVMFQVPEYETVKFVKRRLVKYGLGKGVFLSSIDKVYLEVQADPNTGIETMHLQENDSNMLETFLYNLGFRAGNVYNFRMGFKIQSDGQNVEKSLIEEAKARDHPNAITNVPLDGSPDIKIYQLTLEGNLNDGVEYNVLASKQTKPAPAEPTQRSEMAYSQNANRYGTKWNQKRLNTLIEFMTSGKGFETENEGFHKILDEHPALFPKSETDSIQSKIRGRSNFTSVDIRDKWRNIVGLKNCDSEKKLGVFDRKTAKCDLQKLHNSRTLVLEDHQIQMIEAYLRRQPEYQGPQSPSK